MFHICCILCAFCTFDEHLQIFYKYINIRNLISTGDNGIKYPTRKSISKIINVILLPLIDVSSSFGKLLPYLEMKH